MLPVTWATVRVFLHVVAATVWVGGQITLAALVPGLRALAPDAPRAAARRFNRVAWVAYAVIVATGLWNLVDIDPDWDSDYGRTLQVKLVVVAISGLAAFFHSRATTRRGLAVFGALSGLSALAVVFFGVQIG